MEVREQLSKRLLAPSSDSERLPFATDPPSVQLRFQLGMTLSYPVKVKYECYPNLVMRKYRGTRDRYICRATPQFSVVRIVVVLTRFCDFITHSERTY